VSNNHIPGTKLDLSARNYMDDEFDQSEPKPTLSLSTEPSYLKSSEAPVSEKKEFKPFYHDSDEETKDTVAPLVSK